MSKNIVHIDKQLIEKEVKFFSDLALAVSKTNGLGVRHEEIKQSIIDELPKKASDTIYETLRLGELSEPSSVRGSGVRKSKIKRTTGVPGGWIDDMMLDCTIEEFYRDPGAADKERKKIKGRKITPCGTTAKRDIDSGGFPSGEAGIAKVAKFMSSEKIDKLKEAIVKDREKFDTLTNIVEKSRPKSLDEFAAEVIAKTDTKKKVVKKAKKRVVKKPAKKSKNSKAIKKAVKKVVKKKTEKKKKDKK